MDEPTMPRSPEELNELFPDFEIRQLLGHGGMGIVYEAWQKTLARPVALKLLPPELLRSQEFFDRFQREARIMAQMDHPNVARVYDSGITDDGEAFIVMELVSGKPITALAAGARMNLRRRLELFQQVCSGVQHAHQKGIIHRDLKPSNILVAEVEGRAVPKVIDFGLAKPSDHSSSDAAIWLSANHALGTPAYMSPEQAAGLEIDSRSDIYSIGALLFELLTGRPFLDVPSLHDATRTKIEATIRDTPVPKPSERFKLNSDDTAKRESGIEDDSSMRDESFVAPPIAVRELRGDLDAIVLKALEKSPERRYETVAALSDDIQRHLRHQPVLAVTSNGFYQVKKFCRRHRVGLAIALSFLLVLVCGLAFAIRGSVLARRSGRLAEERLRQGEKLIEFMLGDLHGKLLAVGRLDVLEATIGEVEEFYTQPAASSRSPESLRNHARALLQLGQIRNAQAKTDAAKKRYEEAIRIYETAIHSRPAAQAWRLELGRAWNSLAVLHHLRGEWIQSEKAYREALKLANELLEAEPGQSEWAEFKASVLHNLAALCEANARLDQAENYYTEALHLWEPMQARAPDDLKLIENVSHLHLNLAFLHGRRGQLDQVNGSNERALRLRERLVQLDPANFRYLALLADVQQNISEVHFKQGRLDETEVWLARYRPVREKLAAHDPQNVEWQHALAAAWQNLAALQSRRDHLDAAAVAHRKAWEIYETRFGSEGSSSAARLRWVEGLKTADETFLRLARRAQEQRQSAAAAQHWKTLVEIRAKLASESPIEREAQLSLVNALLDLAEASRNVQEKSAAMRQTYLALLLLEPILRGVAPESLDEDQWKLLWSLASDALPPTAAKRNDHASVREALARFSAESSIDAAIQADSIKWPDALIADFRKLAGDVVNQ